MIFAILLVIGIVLMLLDKNDSVVSGLGLFDAKYSELYSLADQVRNEVNYGLVTQGFDGPVVKFDVV